MPIDAELLKKLLRDLVAIDSIPRAKFARQYQVDDMRDN